MWLLSNTQLSANGAVNQPSGVEKKHMRLKEALGIAEHQAAQYVVALELAEL